MQTRFQSVILVMPFLLLFAGCGRPAARSAPPAPLVSFVQPVARDVIEWDEYTGRLEAVESVELRARVSGYLGRVHFKEGSLVRKGDLLFEIDPRPYQAEFDHAEAEQQRAVSQADLAKNDFERAQRLIDTKAISEEDFDTKAKLYAAAQAAIRSAKAAADAARLNLEFTQVHSPITGRIGRALITEGNLVVGGAGGATLLTTVVSMDPLYCYADVDERSVLKYSALAREGKRDSARDGPIVVELGLANETGYPHAGLVDFLDNRVDPATGTLKARGVFPNPDHFLTPGFFARVRIPGSGKYRALLLPDRAFASDQSAKYVLILSAENKVEVRPVKIGPLIDGLRVVAAGLQGNERVIVDGLLRVRPGMTASPKLLEAL
jgi:RND family efflux transporter MFP subunit